MRTLAVCATDETSLRELSSSVVSGDLNGDGHVDLVFALSKNISGNFGFRSKNLKANTIHVIHKYK